MSRIEQCFAETRKKGKSVLIPYLAAGDPHPKETVEWMHVLVKKGADIIELGVPFSDPIADGKVIQQAYQRALAHDTNLGDVLGMVREFRRDNEKTPVVLMGYQNPIEVMGVETFAEQAKQTGVDGVLIVDLPMEESSYSMKVLGNAGLDTIFLLSPTTPRQRVKKICAVAGGFVYYVSLKGVTGAGNLDISDVKRHVEAIQKDTQLPVCVGFGIQNARDALAISRISSGVVVGSSLVDIIGTQNMKLSERVSKVSGLLSSMRTAMDEHTI